jgi:3-hydroxyisobutyrate dehydrogenase
VSDELSKPRIGWIGTGRMGTELVTRLIGGGWEVAVCNRTRAKAEPLAELGATVVDHPAELAGCDVVFCMVSASHDLHQVIRGEHGLLTAARSPQLIIDSSTVSAEASAEIREAAASRGTAFLAAPVSGNPKVVRAGKLTFAVSGPKAAFDLAEPILRCLGQGATYIGPGEAARLVKIAHNVFLGVVIQSLTEITVLVEKSGTSREAFLSFLNDSVMGSMFSRYKTPALVNLDFRPTFTMPLLLKDFTLGLAAAQELAVPMPLAMQASAIVAGAVGRGHLDEDFAALLLEQAAQAGMTLVPENSAISDGLS